MKIAIEGCAHGELEKIYDTLEYLQQTDKIKIDLLICCGDFQSTRNLDDLETMAIPRKYQSICTFYKYYSGEKKAPMLTIFVGGNHEASNYLQELPYGGWVAPNIYYMGLAGVITINGIRIAGISGIYKGHDYLKGHFEFSPYSNETMRSVYHVRQLEVFRLQQLTNDMDICISHDWPRGVYSYGDYHQLIRYKPHFKDEIDSDKLGSPPLMEILTQLKPRYWFAAHLHCKFSALIHHSGSDKLTRFLALDKCLPKRRFLQIIDIESHPIDDELKIEYDLEWLAILKLTNNLLNIKNTKSYMPGPNGTARYNYTPTEDEKQLIYKKFNENLYIPENFSCTVPPYDANEPNKFANQPLSQLNPQTIKFCDLLGIDDPVNVILLLGGYDLSYSKIYGSKADLNDSMSSLNDDLDSSNEAEVPIKRTSLNLPEPEAAIEETKLDDDEKLTKADGNDELLVKRKSLNLPEPKQAIEGNLSDDIENDEELNKAEDELPVKEKSINLPEPKAAIEENLKGDIETDDKLNKVEDKESELEASLNNSINENIDESSSAVKKFKRRNQSIYQTEDY